MTDPILTTMSLLSRGQIDRATAVEIAALVSKVPNAPAQTSTAPIAIIGSAANLPDSSSYESFWNVLSQGKDCSRHVPPDRQSLCDCVIDPDSDPEGRKYLYGSWLSGIDEFDHDFFDLSLDHARVTDPQQRRLLEVSYHALEDAGQITKARGTRTGIYGVVDSGDYRLAVPETRQLPEHKQRGISALANLARQFDFRGPNTVISCTCSSSAMAVHRACRALSDQECEMALVVGVSMLSFPFSRPSLLADASGIMADDATSRPFDKAATGVGRGEGVVALVLKPLDVALSEGDHIRAVIPASTANNDGLSATLTAPNPVAQTELLTEAWRRAGWSPHDVDYIEAHGTGTALGDPIEIKGLRDAARQHTNRTQFMALGAVKGNIGHLLDGAAGLSGIVKAMLMLEHRQIPPTANLVDPSSHIDFLDSPVYIPTHTLPLGKTDKPIRLGVSCFGFNGTNVHILLESPPVPMPAPAGPSPELEFHLSARTIPQLRRLVELHAQDDREVRAVDLAWTLATGREHHRYRLTLAATTVASFRDQCADLSGHAGFWESGPIKGPQPQHGRIQDTHRLSDQHDVGDPETTNLAKLHPRIVPAPCYPFASTRVWIGEQPATHRNNSKGQ